MTTKEKRNNFSASGMNKKIRLFAVLLSGFFLFLDQFLKWQSTHQWSAPRLLNKFLGWFPALNAGIAFGLPMPNWLIVALTVPIILLVVFLFYKNLHCPVANISLSLIAAGAVSNLFDRLAYHATVDCLLIFTGVINLADIMIVTGLLIFFIKNRHSCFNIFL